MFILRQTNEILTSQSGLALVGSLLKKSDYAEAIDSLPTPENRGNNFKNSDIALSMIGLLAQGKCDFENIEPHRQDPFFPLALHIDRTPSAPRLRQRLDEATAQWDEAALQASVQLLKGYAVQSPCFADYIPLDLDVSILNNEDSNKEGVSKTYKLVDGFAPIFAYLGQEGYLLSLELREGKTHCQNGTEQFLQKTLDRLPAFPHQKYLLRLDSGNDSLDNIRVCQEFNKRHSGKVHIDYIIKRNLRKESVDVWLPLAQELGSVTSPRPGKKIYIGKTYRQVEGFEEPLEIVFKVIERTSSATGQQFLLPEIDVETYWNSLPATPEQVIELYHAHGTSEQYHSEFKGDIPLERLPSGYFQTNTRVMFLGLLAFNILRIIGQESLNYAGSPINTKERIHRRRLRSVMQDLVYLAARLISHGRQWVLGFGKISPFYDTFRYLYLKWAG